MIKKLIVLTATLASTALFAADSPKDEIAAAAKKLGDQPNYTWRSTVAVPEDAPFKPGPTDGKTEKGGITWFSMSMFDNKMQGIVKDKKGAIEQEGAWKSLDEVDKEEGFARMPAMMARNLKTPAAQAADLVSYAKELKKDGDVYSGDLTEEGVKALQSFRRPGGGGPNITDPKGSVKFWVKDGALSKYEFKVQGKMSFNGNDMNMDRTTTVEIKDVGQTKLDVPEAARKKLSE